MIYHKYLYHIIKINIFKKTILNSLNYLNKKKYKIYPDLNNKTAI